MMSVQIMHMVEAAVRALAAGSAVWAVLRLLRVKSVVVEKAAWILLLAAALLMPLLPAGFGLPAAFTARVASWGESFWTRAQKTESQLPQTKNPVSAQAEMAAGDSSAASEEAMAAATPWRESGVPASSAEPAPSASGQTLPGQPRFFWLLLAAEVIYCSVVLLLLVRLFAGLLVALRLWRSSQPVLSVSDFAVRSSRRISSPVTIGSGVLLPADYAGWSEEKLRVALAHEQSHIRQRDFYLQLAAGVYAALFWPSPLGWWLKHKLCELGEAISDRAGLGEAASRSSYARLLLEFAALPRPTVLGVAMARTSHLSQRIERLLNQSSFDAAFAHGRRALLALAVVPVVLCVATALVRVEAATPQEQAPQADAQAPASVPPAQQNEMAPPPPPPPPAQKNAGEPGMMPPPPPPPGGEAQGVGPEPRPEMGAMGPQGGSQNGPDGPGFGPMGRRGMGPRFGFGSRGEAYTLVEGDKDKIGNGLWGHREEIEKASKAAHGHFLWFEHEGKSYIVDDPAIVAQLENTFKAQEDLGKQMREFERLHRDEFRKSRDEFHKSMEKMREARAAETVKVPDLSKEMAELNTALVTLKSKQGATISQAELGEIERKLGEVQRRLGDAQGHRFAPGTPGKLPPLPNMDALNKYGEQMGKLGGQMGKLAQENDQKTRTIIEESLKNGKAKPIN